MYQRTLCQRIVPLLLLCSLSLAADWKAGVGRAKITPEEPVWMSGYGNRTGPSTGVAQDLWAKALALEDEAGARVVIVTTDLIGLGGAVSDSIADRAREEHGLEREQLLLTSSHTHTGPAIAGNIPLMQATDPELRAGTERYTEWMIGRVNAAVGAALEDLKPATLDYRVGRAKFAMNRRVIEDGQVKFGEDPDAPVENDVPVLRVRGADGEVRALLFSYAAHNTTLTGSHTEIHGDYSGFTQALLEDDYPNATALYMMGMGADANPTPRGSMENAERNGQELADAVKIALFSPATEISGGLATEYRLLPLKLEEPPSREEWEKRKASDDKWQRMLAERFLAILDGEGAIADTYDYPIQVVRLGEAATIIAMGGEVVVDYGLRLKREIDGPIWTVGYANDVMGYIPSRRILAEGGYEADFSQVYYGMPGRWAESVEDAIIEAVVEMVDGLQ